MYQIANLTNTSSSLVSVFMPCKLISKAIGCRVFRFSEYGLQSGGATLLRKGQENPGKRKYDIFWWVFFVTI